MFKQNESYTLRCCIILMLLLVAVPSLFPSKAAMTSDTLLLRMQEEVTHNQFKDSYLTLLENYYIEAKKRNDSTHTGNALLMLARHHYVRSPDSMRYYIAQAIPFYQTPERYEDLFRMYAWDIFVMTREERKDEVLEAVQKYRKMAIDMHSVEGLDMIDQAWGNFYNANGMYDEAEQLYNEVLNRMNERGASANRKMKLFGWLYNGLDDPLKRIKYLKMAEDLLNEVKAEGITLLDGEVAVYESEYSILSGYAINYIEMGESEKALKYLKAAEAMIHEHQMTERDIEIKLLYLDYYIYEEEYKQAYPYVIAAEDFMRTHNFLNNLSTTLESKATILKEMGKPEEAFDVHKELLQLRDSLNYNNYQGMIAEMRTKYEVEKLEAEKTELKLQERDAQLKVAMLMGGCTLLLLVIFALLYLMRIVRKNQKAYKEAKEKAEQADQMKSSFLANMNHEIRTPLNAIVGFSQILAEEEDPENKKEYVEIIKRNNELLQQLIGDVLDISKIESNQMSLFYSEPDLQQMMKDVYNTLSLRVPENVRFILDPCQPLTMQIDRNRVIQIITNFLTNAIKHTQEGFIKFGYEVNATTVRFYVEDTGEGIPSEQIETIFNRFIQLENGKKGVGLGLAICKGLVEKMGGKIGVTSTHGKGSVFFFEIPTTPTAAQPT